MGINIEGKVVVVTGASSGIGEATARHLAGEGASVMLGARRKERLEKIVADIRGKGGKAEAREADVRRRGDVDQLVQAAVGAFGRIDVMVNNAGLMPLSSLGQLKVHDWDRMIDVNIKGVLYGIAAALPFFTKQKSGHFINISSVAGHKVRPESAVYSATKHAVLAISEGLRQEAGPLNIRTTVISPGAVATELTGSITDPAILKAMQQTYRTAIPADAVAQAIGWVIGLPPEVDINEIVIRPTAQVY